MRIPIGDALSRRQWTATMEPVGLKVLVADKIDENSVFLA